MSYVFREGKRERGERRRASCSVAITADNEKFVGRAYSDRREKGWSARKAGRWGK